MKSNVPPIDKIVSTLCRGSKVPPRAVLFKGYVGDSQRRNCIRLFFDPALRNYIDIPEDGGQAAASVVGGQCQCNSAGLGRAKLRGGSPSETETRCCRRLA